MEALTFEDGAIQVDAAIVAEGLDIVPPLLLAGMRAGTITSLSERGIDEDSGHYRLTFFSEHRRFRLIVDDSGTILQRSTLDFGALPVPKSMRSANGR